MKKFIAILLAFLIVVPVYGYEVFTDDSDYTLEEFEYVLDGLRTGLKPYAWTILETGKYYGINPLYLLAKFGLESGWGTSSYFVEKNNIGGWRLYDGSFRSFESVEECIWFIAEGLLEYNNPDSWKYTGPNLEDVAYRYCQDDGYAEVLVSIMDELQDEINTYRIQQVAPLRVVP